MTAAPHRRPVRFVTVAEFAAYFAVSTETVRRLIRDGEISALRIRHGIRIPAAEIDRFTRASGTRR